MSEKIEISLKKPIPKKESLIEIFPYGVTLGLDQSRPVLVFKDKTEKHVLPVWLSPLDAGIAMASQSENQSAGSPHTLSQKILKQNNIQMSKCVFKAVKGHHQFVDIHFNDEDKNPPIHLRADYTMSFCLQEKVQFYSSLPHMKKCRELDVEMEQLTVSKVLGGLPPIIERPGYIN